MSEEKDELFKSFKNEEIRKQGTRLGIARILKACPAQIDSAYTVEQVTDGIVEQLKQTYELVPNDSGSWIKAYTRDGKEIDLTQTAHDLFLSSSFVDKASVHAAVESGALAIECKADLRDDSSKVRFIAKYGQEKFEKLPLNRTPKTELDVATMTAKQYNALRWPQRSKVCELVGPDGISKILSRK
jgi:hypothetical protein